MVNFFRLCVFLLSLTLEITCGPTPLERLSQQAKKSNNMRRTNATIKNIKINDSTIQSHIVLPRRWQVGRISRENYEIVNMLWTRPVEVKQSPIISQKSQSKDFSMNTKTSKTAMITADNAQNLFQFKTPSYIEFYYLNEIENDETDSIFKDKNQPKIIPFRNSSKFRSVEFPLLKFRLDETSIKRRSVTNKLITDKEMCNINIKNIACSKSTTVNGSTSPLSEKRKRNFYFTTIPGKSFDTKKIFVQDLFNDSIVKRSLRSTNSKIHSKNINIPLEHQSTKEKINMYNISTTTAKLMKSLKNTEDLSKTDSDRVKFFEMYDNYTPSIENNKESLDYLGSTRDVERYITMKINETSSLHPSKNPNNIPIIVNVTHYENSTKKLNDALNKSRPGSWYDYPYVAVYVYEPSEVQCDAASISLHWLVASASCLSRRNSASNLDVESPFVTYCGESWKYPMRIAYVKYSLIHPKFQLNEDSRRYLYNIGLIQVITPMSANCPGWQPVTLISHYFNVDPKGTLMSAIGWGIDKCKTKAEKFMKSTLMVYEGVVHTSICRGNSVMRRLKGLEENTIKNLYCLSLPPYLGENSDPVHGGLLIIGDKLLALYLQEERHPVGEQSAVYIGIWRHIPWIQDVAKEPDSIDPLALHVF